MTMPLCGYTLISNPSVDPGTTLTWEDQNSFSWWNQKASPDPGSSQYREDMIKLSNLWKLTSEKKRNNITDNLCIKYSCSQIDANIDGANSKKMSCWNPVNVLVSINFRPPMCLKPFSSNQTSQPKNIHSEVQWTTVAGNNHTIANNILQWLIIIIVNRISNITGVNHSIRSL